MPAADAAFARALELWEAGSLQAAHAACLEALRDDAGHVPAAVLGAEILLQVGEPAAAVALLNSSSAASCPTASRAPRRSPAPSSASGSPDRAAVRSAANTSAAEGAAAAGRANRLRPLSLLACAR